jgi:hypothetical protein
MKLQLALEEWGNSPYFHREYQQKISLAFNELSKSAFTSINYLAVVEKMSVKTPLT